MAYEIEPVDYKKWFEENIQRKKDDGKMLTVDSAIFKKYEDEIKRLQKEIETLTDSAIAVFNAKDVIIRRANEKVKRYEKAMKKAIHECLLENPYKAHEILDDTLEDGE